MKNGERCLFRPILPEDEPQLLAFIERVTKEDLYYRYFSEINEFTHDDLANMTQIDYDREMAFVAVQRPRQQRKRDPRRDAERSPIPTILTPSLPCWCVLT